MLLLAVAVGAVAQQGNTVNGAPVSLATAHALPISAGDLLTVTVFDTPELSGSLRVSEKGTVTVPIAGGISVAGMTADQAARAIEDLFREKDILKKPDVSVFIAEYATQGVTVMGEVRTPGIYPLLGGHGLFDLITAAGGVTTASGRSVTITHKDDPAHPEVVQLDNKAGKGAEANVDIRPGDTIFVSKSGIVYVVGDVAKPGGFMIGNGDQLTVLQAMALAQGANRTASLNKARLIRKTSTGREEYSVELKQILANKAPDLPLGDGDILFIPASGVKIWQGRGVDAAITLTTGAVVYGRL
jgi:polysaccharide biosynthesis/export protein